jgi:hypothetical protein
MAVSRSEQNAAHCTLKAHTNYSHFVLFTGFDDTGSIVIVQSSKVNGDTVEEVNNGGHAFKYEYNAREENENGRTLQMFSTLANKTMERPNGRYIEEFKMFMDYYGETDYADKWIYSASENQEASYKTGLGYADFSFFETRLALAEAMSKGTVVLSLFMEVILQLDEAVLACQKMCDTCVHDSIHSLDQAVAFYAGSLEGEDGRSGDGKLFFDLANRRSLNFRTAGEQGNDDVGNSYVNIQVVREFKKMQLFLTNKECSNAMGSKAVIVNNMKVPLIQGVLKHAYTRAYENPTTQESREQVEAEGATYAAGILPFVHNCNPEAAKKIYENMRVGSDSRSLDFAEVKRSFEAMYACMGVSCADVGGLWTVTGYTSNARPCGSIIPMAGETSESPQSPPPNKNSSQQNEAGAGGGLIAVAMIASFSLVALLVVVAQNFARSRQLKKEKEESRRNSQSIAAVSMIIA